MDGATVVIFSLAPVIAPVVFSAPIAMVVDVTVAVVVDAVVVVTVMVCTDT